MRFGLLVLSAVLLASTGSLIGGAAPGDGTSKEPGADLMARIKSAWKSRMDRVRSAHVEWKGDFILPKGFISAYHRDAPVRKASSNPPAIDPPEDIVTPTTGSMLCRDGDMVYTATGKRWDAGKRIAYDYGIRESVVGNVCRLVMTEDLAEFPLGKITQAHKSMGRKQLVHHMLVLHLFGLDPRFDGRFRLDSWEPTNRTTTIHGRPCVELRLPNSNKKESEYLYLDSERGYQVMRQVTYAEDKVTWFMAADYKPHPELGWMVDTFEHTVRPNGKDLVSSSRLTVTRFDLNRDLTASEFELKFPPGTMVFDTTTGKEYRSLVDDSGNEREPLPSVPLPSMEQLKAQPLVQSAWSRYVWISITASVFIASLCGWIYLRWRKAAT